jgi:hypothetical protein
MGPFSIAMLNNQRVIVSSFENVGFSNLHEHCWGFQMTLMTFSGSKRQIGSSLETGIEHIHVWVCLESGIRYTHKLAIYIYIIPLNGKNNDKPWANIGVPHSQTKPH